MDDSLPRISRSLAQNLAGLRKKRGLSQQALARLARIPRSTLANLESGAGNPSLANLARISGALQIGIEELLSRPRSSVKLIKSSEVRTVRRSQGAVEVFKLLPDPLPGMEMDRVEIVPGGRLGGVPHVPGTKEYLTCIVGEVTVTIAGEKHRIEPGDVLAFPGDQPHSYQNTGTRTAICLSVVVLAAVGMS